MLPDHSESFFGFMLIRTDSPGVSDRGLIAYPHSARPHGSMRTDPFFPSVCQSPSGVVAGASSSTLMILGVPWGAGRVTAGGGATGGEAGGTIAAAAGGATGAATGGAIGGAAACGRGAAASCGQAIGLTGARGGGAAARG